MSFEEILTITCHCQRLVKSKQTEIKEFISYL